MPITLEKRRTYRRRTARSLCRKKDGKKCLRVKGCKQTKKTMKRKSYCRKSKKHMVKGGAVEGTPNCTLGDGVLDYLTSQVGSLNNRQFWFKHVDLYEGNTLKSRLKHSDSYKEDTYLDGEPFTKYTLYFDVIGNDKQKVKIQIYLENQNSTTNACFLYINGNLAHGNYLLQMRK